MNKTVCTLLLDENDNYVYEDGSLPIRPLWDKELLSAFVMGESVSNIGYNMLAKGMRGSTNLTHSEPYPISVPEIDALADILIVSRGRSRDMKGKRFRFTRFKRILSTGGIEIWRRSNAEKIWSR